MWHPKPEEIKWYMAEVNPEPWAVGPVGVNRRGGRISAYVSRNAQLHAFQEAVREELEHQNPVMATGRIGLLLAFWRDRPEYTTEAGRKHRKHDADLTNLQKAVEDACQGILFENDTAVEWIQSVRVQQSADVMWPKIYIGVFEIPDDEDLESQFDFLEDMKERKFSDQIDLFQPPAEDLF